MKIKVNVVTSGVDGNEQYLTIRMIKNDKMVKMLERDKNLSLTLDISSLRTIDQNSLMWKLYEITVKISNPEYNNNKEVRIMVNQLYESDMMNRAPRVQMLVPEKSKEGIQKEYKHTIFKKKHGDEYLIEIIRTSHLWTKTEISEHIEYMYYRLSQLESGDYNDELYELWKCHRKHIDHDYLYETGACTPAIYREKNHRCEACGRPGPGEVSHIKSRGAGGQDLYENMLFLCTGCHREIQHQQGWSVLVKKYNWIKEKVTKII